MSDTIHAGYEFFYPRQNPQDLTVSLSDVRAANDIVITYDFDRDGWAIVSPVPNMDDLPEELEEVAFIPAWTDRAGAMLEEMNR